MKQNYDKHLATRIGAKQFKLFHRLAKRHGGVSTLLRKLIDDFLAKETAPEENTHVRTEN